MNGVRYAHMTARKSRRIRTRASVVVAAVLAVSAAACSSAAPGAGKNSTLTVVTLNPFTGPDAPFGPEQAAGCQAAAAAINAAGGVVTPQADRIAVGTAGQPAH